MGDRCFDMCPDMRLLPPGVHPQPVLVDLSPLIPDQKVRIIVQALKAVCQTQQV
jgi:hypothetical protein